MLTYIVRYFEISLVFRLTVENSLHVFKFGMFSGETFKQRHTVGSR